MAQEQKQDDREIVARNKRARHDYHILDSWEAGLVLTGTEVKSLREGKATLVDAYALVKDGEVFLLNLHISPYEKGNQFNHEPTRTRKVSTGLLIGSGVAAGVAAVFAVLAFEAQGEAQDFLSRQSQGNVTAADLGTLQVTGWTVTWGDNSPATVLPANAIGATHTYADNATRSVLGYWISRLQEETGDDFPEKVTAFRDGMAVHGRYRQPCPSCGSPVQRVVYAANEANYCATCQTGGRLLADRSLSRLLREDWPRTLEELEARRTRQ